MFGESLCIFQSLIRDWPNEVIICNLHRERGLNYYYYYFFFSQGYTDEPIGKILSNVAESEVILLDRWELRVEKNTEAEATEEGKENLPLNVVNNYFSLGVDAHIALEFHEARG